MQDGSPDFGARHVHPGCQPPSDEGCCRDARSPGPRLTQGEVKTTPKASVTPHQQQPPTQQPQPRHTPLPRLRPRTWTWITPNAYLPRVCFGRRPAVRRKPHNKNRFHRILNWSTGSFERGTPCGGPTNAILILQLPLPRCRQL